MVVSMEIWSVGPILEVSFEIELLFNGLNHCSCRNINCHIKVRKNNKRPVVKQHLADKLSEVEIKVESIQITGMF